MDSTREIVRGIARDLCFEPGTAWSVSIAHGAVCATILCGTTRTILSEGLFATTIAHAVGAGHDLEIVDRM